MVQDLFGCTNFLKDHLSQVAEMLRDGKSWTQVKDAMGRQIPDSIRAYITAFKVSWSLCLHVAFHCI
jgi:hypothetical protein